MPGPDLALFWAPFGASFVLKTSAADIEHRFSHQTSQRCPGIGWRAFKDRSAQPQRHAVFEGDLGVGRRGEKPQRLALGIKATAAGVEEAKEIGREAWNVIKAGGDPQTAPRARQTALKKVSV